MESTAEELREQCMRATRRIVELERIQDGLRETIAELDRTLAEKNARILALEKQIAGREVDLE